MTSRVDREVLTVLLKWRVMANVTADEEDTDNMDITWLDADGNNLAQTLNSLLL